MISLVEAIKKGQECHRDYRHNYEMDLLDMPGNMFLGKYSVIYCFLQGSAVSGPTIIQYNESDGDKVCLRCDGKSSDEDFVGYCLPCLAALGLTKQQWKNLQK